MELTDFNQGSIWSIQPEILDGLIRKYGENPAASLPIGAASLLPGRESTETKPYQIESGVALIPVRGTILKRQGFWSLFFGATSIEWLTKTFTVALGDPEVSAIVLSIDSPGGTVSGIEILGDLIFNSAKPVVAFGDGMMTSAAYWIGSAARSVIVGETSQAGSIGVLMVHYDYSKSDEQFGLKRTYLSAGKFKALGNDAEPLSQDARTMYEGWLNYYYDLFINAVARNRKVEPQAVIGGMAEGRIFIGSQAIEAGLADGTGNLQDAIEAAQALAEERNPKNITRITGANSPGKEPQMSKEAMFTSVEALAAAYPEFAQALREEGVKSVDKEKIRTEATKAERERILGLASIQSGDEAGKKLRAVVEQGITPEAFKAVMDAMGPTEGGSKDGEEKKKILAELKKTGAENPGSGNPPTPSSDKDFMTLVDEHVLVHKITKTQAMQEVMRKHPDVHAAYIKKMNS